MLPALWAGRPAGGPALRPPDCLQENELLRQIQGDKENGNAKTGK